MCVTSHMTKTSVKHKDPRLCVLISKKNETKKCFGGQNIKICLKEIVKGCKALVLFSLAHALPRWRSKDYTEKKENQIFLVYKDIQSGAVAS